MLGLVASNTDFHLLSGKTNTLQAHVSSQGLISQLSEYQRIYSFCDGFLFIVKTALSIGISLNRTIHTAKSRRSQAGSRIRSGVPTSATATDGTPAPLTAAITWYAFMGIGGPILPPSYPFSPSATLSSTQTSRLRSPSVWETALRSTVPIRILTFPQS